MPKLAAEGGKAANRPVLIRHRQDKAEVFGWFLWTTDSRFALPGSQFVV